MLPDNTLSYYTKNLTSFVNGTQSLDFHDTQDRFLSYLSPSASILDFGCGAGRDTKYFLDKGYRVSATDGSEALCAVASEFTGIPVKQMLFEELDDVGIYDGIWACSSILHVPVEELPDIFRRMIRALKDEGVLYTSFKYGRFAGLRGERFFTDFDEESFTEFVGDFPELSITSMWVTSDVRPGRSDEKWLNTILHKSTIS